MILFSLTVGCKTKSSVKPTDLKFADFDRKYITLNDVDTVFLISNNQKLNLGGSDTFGYRKFDKEGRLLNEWKRVFGGHFLRNEYNSIGLIKRKLYSTDFRAQFEATYNFVEDSLLLYQLWKGNDEDTCWFKFDVEGKLILSEEYANDDHGRGRHFRREFIYDINGLLIKKNELLLLRQNDINRYEQEYGTALSTENKTNYYYTNGKIDSSVTTYIFPSNRNKDYISKTIFNDKGLYFITIEMDTLITHYAYKTR